MHICDEQIISEIINDGMELKVSAYISWMCFTSINAGYETEKNTIA